ncbi:MAG TPA: amino-acid N-acetyltransferase [Spirochaetia bacterium]|nr:amino-acid N-acetyltransferase [Spirochaetia bacterium]
MDDTLKEQVDLIRQVFGYANRFRGKIFVFKIDYSIIEHPLFPVLIRDLVMMHRIGMQVIIVPGARERIDEILSQYGISCQIVNDVRISTEEAMPFIKMAAFDAANRVMSLLSGSNVSAVIGNWVGARSMGVLQGVDYKDAGVVDRINVDMAKKVLADGLIPIFPCIGWNSVGRPYNISSDELATILSVDLKAEKLFFVNGYDSIKGEQYELPDNPSIAEDSHLSRLTLSEAAVFLLLNAERKPDPLIDVMKFAHRACAGGVQRVHVLDGRIEGAILKEVFSNLGNGTMIYSNQYEQIRAMRQEDVSDVLRIMHPLVSKGILIARSRQQLEEQLSDFVVYEVDGTLHACGGLHRYSNGAAEILGIAVDNRYVHYGIGQKVVEFLISKAGSYGIQSVFVLTTQTSDWFQRFGFRAGEVSELPEEKRAVYDVNRNSRVLTLEVNLHELPRDRIPGL